ncbi:hypothetical protein C1645_831518 [Glomus cerebriforme]|uniref:Attractin/MKLN-like beta-propeller domain-containing protein n=1 Tax=Glomus cerebriforme TaxID=658196 RepID=A0A397SQK5_9GLOM|nr:hypothetical protein C1645_831518 [Glomus cerebriforme]
MVYGQNYIPGPRVGHAAVYIGDNIYFIGGQNFNDSILSEIDPASPKSDFFYLDFKRNYGNFLSWEALTKIQYFIVGGQHWDNTNTNYLYRFDIKSNGLSVPIIQGKAPPTRKGMNSVSYEGKIYMFGGQMGSGYDITLFSNFDILDTVNLNWQVGSLVNSPITRTLYTATLVNGVIYYIGGKGENNVYTPMTEIYQYDIVGDAWSLKKAITADTRNMQGPRIGHSAVLVDGKICIYGGSYSSDVTPYPIPPKETIAMLDTITLVWSIPSFTDPHVPNLAFHTATLLFKTMYVAFGNITDVPNRDDKTNKLNCFFKFDDSNIDWYPANSPTTIMTKSPIATIATSSDAKTNPQQPSSQNKIVIVGVSIGLVAVFLTILVVLSLTYRHKKNQVKSGNSDGSDAFKPQERDLTASI